MELEQEVEPLPPTSPPGNGVPKRESEDTKQPSASTRLLSSHNDCVPNVSASASTDQSPSGPPQGTKLYRSSYALISVVLYSVLAILSWVLLCILSYRPITISHYGAWQAGLYRNDYNDKHGLRTSSEMHALYQKNERWYTAARVMQSIVSVLTIPVTSAVCSSAAIVFLQRHTGGTFTLRKLLTLADRGWTDPTISSMAILHWKRYGSSFLLASMLLCLLGGLITPLQQVALSSKTIKTPISIQSWYGHLDIPDQWPSATEGQQPVDDDRVVLRTRLALQTATNTVPQAQLWQGGNFSCSSFQDVEAYQKSHDTILPPSACGMGNTLGNMSELYDPFLTEFPIGFSTGLIRQFAPRISSSATYESLPSEQWPSGCESQPTAFYVEYQNVSIETYSSGPTNYTTDPSEGQLVYWGIRVCMPGNQSISPWTNTRKAQKFTEELYINVTTNLFEDINETLAEGLLFRIRLNTTAGYFELPNYMNDEKAGPLVEGDPIDACGPDCWKEEWEDAPDRPIPEPSLTRRNMTFDQPNHVLSLERVVNKGPLLTIALALFGNNSFVASRLTNSATYPQVPPSSANAQSCVELAPMLGLTPDERGRPLDLVEQPSNLLFPCITNTYTGVGVNQGRQIPTWLTLFLNPPERLANAFTAAAFLANQAWMTYNVESGDKTLKINYDMGADTQVPHISLPGIVVISVLMGIYLSGLLLMAVYAIRYPRWADRLDGLTMLCLGSAMAGRIELKVGRNKERIGALDELPGWVGEGPEAKDGGGDEVRSLKVGASKHLDGKTWYESY